MKLSIAIADTHALPSAFVVYRGFEENIPKAAALGYHGVELALKNAGEINVPRLEQLLGDHGVEVSCISTGQVYADAGLSLTHERREKREEVKKIFYELIDLARGFGKMINIGRVRGRIGSRPKAEVEAVFVEMARDLCQYALAGGVELILEPVNRYEVDFVNSVEEGVDLLKKVGMPNMKLMPDVFHMNIEDRHIGQELARHIEHIRYIHMADSNRLAPGWGHLDFEEVFRMLLGAGYNGWVSAEILPQPDPDKAAHQAARFLLPFIHHYNLELLQLNGKDTKSR